MMESLGSELHSVYENAYNIKWSDHMSSVPFSTAYSRLMCFPFFSRWRANELIKSIPPKDLPQIRAKVAAVELLKGHRADIGLQRTWHGNYIASVSLAGDMKLFSRWII